MYLIKSYRSPLPSGEIDLKDNKLIARVSPKAIHKSLSDRNMDIAQQGGKRAFFISKTGIVKENKL